MTRLDERDKDNSLTEHFKNCQINGKIKSLRVG